MSALRRLFLLLVLPIALSACASEVPKPFTPRTFSVLGSGDVLLHPPLWQQAHDDALAQGGTGYDFDAILAAIAPEVGAADLAICELETPLAPATGPFSGWPEFSVPPQVLSTLKKVGYDECTTASNHSLDKGFEGIVRTLEALDAAGLRHAGSARSRKEALTPLVITLDNGVRVASLAYSYGFNGHALPVDKPWAANPIDAGRILADAGRARQAGAQVVVVSLHWGTEYNHAATDAQQRLAAELLASPDIDLILGAHAHVVQPFANIDGKWVAYGMGNLIARHEDPVNGSREGVLAKFTFTETTPQHFHVTRAEAIPVWTDLEPALRLVDLPRALADPHIAAEKRQIYRAARARIVQWLDAEGAVAKGLVIR